MAANRAGENPGEGYEPYLYYPITTPNESMFTEGCVASSLIMVQGADSVWRMADRSGSWKPVAEVSEPKVYTARFFVPRYRRITIENTWALRDPLDPQIKPAPMMPLQSCTGQSIGPAGTFPVGLQERNGGIAIAVRSGPLGTKCMFQTKAALLPPGVRIVNVTWAVRDTGGSCRNRGTFDAQDMAELTAFFAYHMTAIAAHGFYALMIGDVPSSAYVFATRDADDDIKKQTFPAVFIDPLVSGTYTTLNMSTHGFVNPFLLPAPMPTMRYEDRTQSDFPGRMAHDVFWPMGSMLKCLPSLANDHEMSIVLERVVADIPEGVRFP
jgi:hypothetical protein